MSIDLKKFRFAAVAFVCGYLACAMLTAPQQTQPQSKPIVASGPLLRTTEPPVRERSFVWESAPRYSVALPRGFGAAEWIVQDPRFPARASGRNVDLIDFRHRVDGTDIE